MQFSCLKSFLRVSYFSVNLPKIDKYDMKLPKKAVKMEKRFLKSLKIDYKVSYFFGRFWVVGSSFL